MKVDLINRYFKLIGDLDVHHQGAQIGKRLYGDMGKLLYTKAGKPNTGFITGLYEQLDMIEDLRRAGKNVRSLEQRIDEDGIVRYVDIILEDGTKIETKNFTHLSKINRDNLVAGFKKDIAHLLNEAKTAADPNLFLQQSFNKLKYTIRGGMDQFDANDILKLEDEMKEAAKELLNRRINKKSIKKSYEALEGMLKAVERAGNGLPLDEDLLCFRGKNIPY
jgi:hypothetical protein